MVGGETVERKLRQIYDAFDGRNYKVRAAAGAPRGGRGRPATLSRRAATGGRDAMRAAPAGPAGRA
jgi:hypothetical protein